MSANKRTEPQQWVFLLFLAFGGAQLIAGVVYFFAFNWRALPDMAKIAAPQAVMAVSFLLWAMLGTRSRFGAVAGLLAVVMIGVSMGVVGQVYQLGADPWRLFAVWAALALPAALIARSDAHFALFFLIASIAYFLYADEELRWLLPKDHADSAIPGVYALAATGLILVRERIDGGAPGWERWFFIVLGLGAGLVGAMMDIAEASKPFADSFIATLCFVLAGGAILAAYRYWRPDKPAQALTLFAASCWLGLLGVRLIFLLDMNSAGSVSFAFFLSAGWVIAVTAGLAAALRRMLRDGAGGAQ